MSLINQVLQDLEKRHADPEEIRGTARAVRALPEDRASRVRSIVTVAIAVMAVAGGSAWYFVEQRTSAQTPEAVSKVPDTPTPPARAIASSPAQASEVPAASVVSANAQTKSEDKVAQASIAPTLVSQSVAMATQPPATAPVVQAKPEANSAAANKRAGIAANTTALLAPAKAVAPVFVAPGKGTVDSQAKSPRTDTGEVSTEAAAAGAPGASSSMLEEDDKAVARERSQARAARRQLARETSSAAAAPSGEQPDGGPNGRSNIHKQVKPPSPQERAEADFREALSELQNGDAINAEVLLKRALGADPLADKARQALLGIYMQAGRRDAAESLLEERLELDRSRAGFALALARLQLERSGNSEALTTLQRSAAFGEGSADFQALYANALSRLNRHREAAERYAAAARLAPRNPLWQMALAMELRADNRLPEARTAYLRAQELGGLNAQLTSFVEQQLRELH